MPGLLQSVALGGLEDVVNRALQLDPASNKRLEALNGRRFAIKLQEPELFIAIAVNAGKLRLSGEDNGTFDTRLTGRWTEFARIATADDPAAALINGDVTVEGDTAPLLELRHQLSQLELDWERPLASSFGDIAAHQIGKGLRSGQRWLSQSSRTARRQIEDFLLEESRLLPHPYQAEDFYRQVDDLRTRSERLEARLRRLKQRVADTTNNKA
jgi:ubiquinone biosynthesis accessory factor UbiJ